MQRHRLVAIVLLPLATSCGAPARSTVAGPPSPAVPEPAVAVRTASVDPETLEGPTAVSVEPRYEVALEGGETVRFVDIWTLPWECWPGVGSSSPELTVLHVVDDASVATDEAEGPATLLTSEGLAERAVTDSGPASGWGWVAATRVARSERLVGALDWRVEDAGWEVVIVESLDGGGTWSELSRVRKPHYMAHVASLAIEPDGTGELEVALEDCADCGVTLGSYVHATTDGGRTWEIASQP